jgi:uncharacterized protein (DUF169 family)
MPDWIDAAQALNKFIRPLTFPVAVKLVKSADHFPEKTRRPLKDLGFKTNVCVGLTLTRKYGWTVGFTAEDNACPIAEYTYGWSESESRTRNALMEFMKVMNYVSNDDAARTTMEAVASVKINKGTYAGVIFSPLERTKIEPDLVMVFCNAAQVMRLVHGATQETGISVKSLFSGRGGTCGEGILQTFKTKEPKVVLPGNGDRVWAMVQDDELAFTIPVDLLDSVIKGIEATHERGIRYPIPLDVRHEPTFPGQLRQVKQ